MYSIYSPPGATIRELLDNKGMTQRELAERLNISFDVSSRLLDGELAITPYLQQLESILGPSVTFWNNLEARWQMRKEETEP